MSNINLNGNDMNDVNTDNGENNTSSEEGEMTNTDRSYCYNEKTGKPLNRPALAKLVNERDDIGKIVSGAFTLGASTTSGGYTWFKANENGDTVEYGIRTGSVLLPVGTDVIFENGVEVYLAMRGDEGFRRVTILDKVEEAVGAEEPAQADEDVDADATNHEVLIVDAAPVVEDAETTDDDAGETPETESSAAPAQPKKKARRGKRGGRRNRGKRGGNAAKVDNAAKPASSGKGKKAKRPSTYETLKNAFIDRRFDLPALSGKGYVVEVFYVNGKPVLRVETGSYDSADIIVDVLARDEDQETLFAALKPGDFITYIPDPFTPQADSLEINGGEYPLYRIVRGFSLKLEKAASEHEEGEPKAHLPAPNLFGKVAIRDGRVKDEYGRLITFGSAAERQAILRYAGQVVDISGLVDMHKPTSNGSLCIHKVKVYGQALVANQSRAKRFARRGGAPYRADQRAA